MESENSAMTQHRDSRVRQRPGFTFAVATVSLFWMFFSGGVCASLEARQLVGDSLQDRLKKQSVSELAARVVADGDAARGAMLYYTPSLTCMRCHEASDSGQRLGPEIATLNVEATVEHLIESLLLPSLHITEGFQTQSILTISGEQLTGLVVEEDKSVDGFVMLADPGRDGLQTRIDNSDIDERRVNKVSAMPDGLVGGLASEQSFLDLVRYLVEIKKGGNQAVMRLRPVDSFFAIEPLPEFEANIDHAGLIHALNDDSLERGAAIYQRFCARCHGTLQQEGSMPSARRFSDSLFKNGNDPYSMYRTLTHGYGLMVPQRWMVPRQKYDVIHYIREHYVQSSNSDQYFSIDDKYLARLPVGNDFGPDPVEQSPWSDMDYGNFLINTLEVGDDGTNIAYKGIAIRLDAGPGGVSQGHRWILYEHDTMRVAAAWSGNEFIDYNGIHFNDQHQIHPRIVGDIHFTNDHRPGWANPLTNSFDDDPRVAGRDGKLYGPLPNEWLQYRGLFQFDDRVVIHYQVGDSEILESPSLDYVDDQTFFTRTINVEPRDRPLLVKVASVAGLVQSTDTSPGEVFFEVENRRVENEGTDVGFAPDFDGTRHLVAKSVIDWRSELTVAARIKCSEGGTIVCQTNEGSTWVPGGTSLFIRDGRLVFDIGWVGEVTSSQSVADYQWHTVALVWNPDEETAQLFIDGQLDETGELESGDEYSDPVLRIGYTAADFPAPHTAFIGEMSNLRIWDRVLNQSQVAAITFEADDDSLDNNGLIGDWVFGAIEGALDQQPKLVSDNSPRENHAEWVQIGRSQPIATRPTNLHAHVAGIKDPQWKVVDDSLCLQIPAGQESLAFAISTSSNVRATTNSDDRADLSTRPVPSNDVADLKSLTRGGPPRYPDVLSSIIETKPTRETDPFAVDFLKLPEDPWDCRKRLTGLDFFDGEKAVVCSWDGSVWEVSMLPDSRELSWRRIAHGLFQPLGIRVFNDQIYVACRDQIVALEDLNDDGFIDYYRAFNSDHQVTEHFHEFAMGLQSDDEGNLYYAKSARHALPALVPHHGTLLKVSSDGSDTEIVANGFRAANGICLNDDGSFFVTDQEGHWNPKNRINWVEPGGFYGNMLGYHNVTDESDDAMQQPLCWITNAFDRSPGELLWVPENTWGSLGGSLLNLSYGMGQVFVVPYEKVQFKGANQWQGGMCSLPIPLFPTGVMRGRFHSDGNLYCCGMYAWAGNQQEPGGLYRIRHTGQPAFLPKVVSTSRDKISIEFTDELDESSISQIDRYTVGTWNIDRTANYGSDHLDERQLQVAAAGFGKNRRTVELTVPDLSPVRCMEIRCRFKTSDGNEVTRVIHNTIHAVGNKDE